MLWYIKRKCQFGTNTRTVIILQTAVILYLCLYILSNKDKEWRMVLPSTSKDDQLINLYLSAYETQCQNMSTVGRKLSNVQTPLCPCVSPRLRGKLHPSQKIVYRPWDEISREVGKSVLPGGIFRPPDCLARLRVALVIPYRDREIHLRQVIRHLHPVLQKQLLEYRIFVIEQNLPVIFNKASMMNIAYLESAKLWPLQDCIIFHDVDMLMEDDRNLFYCGDKPHHMGVYTDKFKYKVLYASMFGGVLSFKREQFYQVNGYSNNYFGWGGEDDDMYNRVKAQALNFTRPAAQVARYTQLRHQRDGGNPVNNDVAGAWKTRPEVYKVDGVRQVQYKVLEINNLPLYTWIHVDLNVSNLHFRLKANITQYDYTVNKELTCLGNDLSSHQVSRVTCQFSCDRKPNCAGFVYNSLKDTPCFLKYKMCDNLGIEKNSTVYVKNIEPKTRIPIKKSSGALTLIHTFERYEGDCHGGDIGGYDLNYEDCADKCDKDTACIAFQFAITHENACWLKKQCNEKQPNPGLSLNIKGPRVNSKSSQERPNS